MDLNLEFLQSIYDTLKQSDVGWSLFVGIKAIAAVFFSVNIYKKYFFQSTDIDGPTWGLRPKDIVLNLLFLGLIVFSSDILKSLDAVLVHFEDAAIEKAPPFIPIAEVPKTQANEVSSGDLLMMSLLGNIDIFEMVINPLLKKALWLIDVFMYPLFLAERFFLIGFLQLFFPLIMAFAMLDEFRDLAIRFFKLYIAVYLLVPAFIFVNYFIGKIYSGFKNHFLSNLLGTDLWSGIGESLLDLTLIVFIILLKLRLYRKSGTFLFKLFT